MCVNVINTQGDIDVISMPAGFRRHLVCKTLKNVFFHCDIAEIRFVGKVVIIHFHKPTDRILFKYDKSSPLNSTHHFYMLYPQNGDRIVAIDSVTSLHPVYKRQVHGVSQRRQRTNEPWPWVTCTENLVKNGHVTIVLNICPMTERHTDRQTDIITNTQYPSPFP